MLSGKASLITDIAMDNIPQAHDRFLKELLSHPERAGALLRERLPDEIARFLSSEPPELVDASFVDERLHGHLSDRLFKVETINRQTAFVYVLIEHKSTPDDKVGWQLLRYMVEILKQWEQQQSDWDRLPAVIPLVFYHGAREWKIPNEFLHLVNAEEAWKPYLPNFRFPVLDLGKIPDKQLSGNRRLNAWLLVMKYATRKKQQMAIRDLLIETIKSVPEDLRPIVYYFVQTYRYDEQTLREIIRKIRPEEENKMMSQFAQDIEKRVRQESIQEGMRQGRLEGLLEGEARGEAKLLIRQLSRRFQPLPDQISDRVYAAGPGTIEIWADRVLEAKSLDDIFTE
uniref:Transposase (putative) YhgA-like domain-containing protein n=1 Tax=Candidatus Kentrum sp. LPFa TaxID=2126335 RepID=A0A450WQ70_9GAMM|nr:MAG: conserved hypothetical protein (putative transposase or invertase) [Candidatus Kentron sp. LPFa]